ncbi:MAG: hypothetical protein EZS28_031756 [Streblomastix strix]|uniref:Uncharacterized protein n=1 Tax=Streblomastix strix TaxID=222440 RepID=A0A5J4UQM6_9EUKA|nr:MAG: hypothetical protein EZS28_031756 [Streblomastix strix]
MQPRGQNQSISQLSPQLPTSLNSLSAQTQNAYRIPPPKIYTLTHHTHQVTEVSFHPNGEFFASSSYDKSVAIWSVPQKKVIFNLPNHHFSYVTTVDWQPSPSNLIASAGVDGRVLIFDLNASKFAQTLSSSSKSNYQTQEYETSITGSGYGNPNDYAKWNGAEHNGPVLCVRWHQNGNIIGSVSEDRHFFLIEPQSKNGKPVHTFCSTTPLKRLIWSQCGRYVALCGRDSILILTYPDLQLFSALPQSFKSEAAEWNAEGELAFIGEDGDPYVFDTNTGMVRAVGKEIFEAPPDDKLVMEQNLNSENDESDNEDNLNSAERLYNKSENTFTHNSSTNDLEFKGNRMINKVSENARRRMRKGAQGYSVLSNFYIQGSASCLSWSPHELSPMLAVGSKAQSVTLWR